MNNFILKTDSYKLTHWAMYPYDTAKVYSYFECREGKGYQNVVWFGLQALLKKYFEGAVVTQEMIDKAEFLAKCHFGTDHLFNQKGWQRIVDVHGGKLPLEIRAMPEGKVYPRGTPLMTVENTNPELPWLTNAVESLLTHVWYPTTVATVSRDLRDFFNANVPDGAPQFMLHDFGYRGVSSDESAGMGGMAHLLAFLGTDTLVGMEYAQEYYSAGIENLAFSIPASEHSIMTAEGPRGEEGRVRHMLCHYPGSIVSIVADSYDYYNCVRMIVKNLDLATRGKTRVVIRPDSPTPQDPNPKDLIQWTLENSPEEINVLWGDGLSPDQIKEIVLAIAPSQRKRLVFGMGGGLLQKVNRDTLRCTFKCSDRTLLDGSHVAVQKKPLDASKTSKSGRFDGLTTVFKNGIITSAQTWDEVRNI